MIEGYPVGYGVGGQGVGGEGSGLMRGMHWEDWGRSGGGKIDVPQSISGRSQTSEEEAAAAEDTDKALGEHGTTTMITELAYGQ
jgi:hypothetical protein